MSNRKAKTMQSRKGGEVESPPETETPVTFPGPGFHLQTSTDGAWEHCATSQTAPTIKAMVEAILDDLLADGADALESFLIRVIRHKE